MLGTGPLPGWLRNRVHSRTMAALDTFNDNLYLWSCIMVSRGVRVDHYTEAARTLAGRYHGEEADDYPSTLLNELGQIEEFLNASKPEAEKTGTKVYEPERAADGIIYDFKAFRDTN